MIPNFLIEYLIIFMEHIINLLDFLTEYLYSIIFVEHIINLPNYKKLFWFIGLFLLFSLLILCNSNNPELDLLLLFLLFLYILLGGGGGAVANQLYYIIMHLGNLKYVSIINSLPIFI